MGGGYQTRLLGERLRLREVDGKQSSTSARLFTSAHGLKAISAAL